MLILNCKIDCILNCEQMSTEHQICSIVYRYHFTSLTPESRVYLTSINIKGTWYVYIYATNSNEGASC